MPAAVYPFTRFVYPGGQKDRRAYARLPLRITNPHTRQTLVTWGLVDTGADLTLLPGELAVRGRLNLQREGFPRQALPGSTSPTDSGNLTTVMTAENYEMIIGWSDEDAAYVVEVPQLPGCLAHGATRQDALRNADDVLRFWIKTAQEDGLEIPQPRGRLMYA